MKQSNNYRYITGLSLLLFLAFACGKGGDGGSTPDPCAGVTVNVTGTVTHPTSNGGTNGSLTVAATGGTGFTYKLGSGAYQTGTTFSGLAAGTYTITAKNAAGCTGTASFTLNNPADPCNGVNITVTATVTNPTAPATSTGTITAAAAGSTGFTYSLNGAPYQASGSFTGLAAGAYTVTAKDGNGCTGNASFTLTDPNPCAGVTIAVTAALTNPTAAGTSNGSIAASASGGSGAYTFNIGGGAYQASGTFSGLAAGNYTIGAKDANGCTGSATFTLTAPNPCAGVTITVSNTITGNTPCLPANGSLLVAASGGTSPYTYNLNSGAFQASANFTGLAAGTYTTGAKDANGCSGTSGAATIQNLAAGPLFMQVRDVLNTNCVSCHNNSQSEGGMNWTVDCNVVSFKDRIKARAVDANPSAMPPTGQISLTDRQKITNWINAGGRFTD